PTFVIELPRVYRRHFCFDGDASVVQEPHTLDVTRDRIADFFGLGAQLYGAIVEGRLFLHSFEGTGVIGYLLVRKLKAMGLGNNDYPLVAVDPLAFDQLAQCGERHTRVRAIEHAGTVGARHFFGELQFRSLFDDAVEALYRRDRFANAHRITDLNRTRQGLARCDRLKVIEVLQIGKIKGVGILRLRYADARQL